MAGAKFFIAPSLALSLLAVSCNEDSTIGLDVQPEGDLLHTRTSDTASIITYTLREDSVKTDDLPSGTALIGSYNDPVFGYTEASLYSQFQLPTNGPQLGGLTLDSIVLSLAYEGLTRFYGSVTDGDVQTFRVYQVIEDIKKESSYYSNQTVNVYPVPLGSATFNPSVTDSVLVGGVKEKPQVRIKLDKTFGQLLMDAGSNLDNNTVFTQYFKGLLIKPETPNQPTSEGAILYFNLLDGKSGLTLYYKEGTVAKTYRLVVNANTARFGNFRHTYPSSGPVAAQLLDSTLGQNLTYVQSIGGVKAHILFPHLENFTDSGKIAINRAELVIKADPSYIESKYPAPNKLFLIPVTSTGAAGNLLTWPDFQEGLSYYGGIYDPAAKEYRFTINRHIQSILDGRTTDYGLYLVVSGNSVTADRLVMGGGGNPNHRIKLRLTYTKLD